MKRIILLVTFVALTGCAPTMYRVGTISIPPFEIVKTAKVDPLTVTQEVAKNVQDTFNDRLLNEINENTQLKPVAGGCSVADYELLGRITQIESDIDSHYRFVTSTVNKRVSMDVKGILRDCKTGYTVVEFDLDKDKESAIETIEYLAGKIVKKIAKVK
ncbi:MAG: LPS assembly lipoprotein LptE [Desulfuromonadales bacterium]|nr:LPS assembly lipoprotein LptE [Desulfuromonadales bacterium]